MDQTGPLMIVHLYLAWVCPSLTFDATDAFDLLASWALGLYGCFAWEGEVCLPQLRQDQEWVSLLGTNVRKSTCAVLDRRRLMLCIRRVDGRKFSILCCNKDRSITQSIEKEEE